MLSARQTKMWVGGLSLWLTACATPKLPETIGTFQASVTSASTTLGTYYAGLNQLEREIYLNSAAYGGKPVFWQEGGAPTPLQGRFSLASIKQRLATLELLAAYGEKLASLAGSTAPADFATQTVALGEAFKPLPAAFEQLSQSQGTLDPTALQYVGPVSKLTGVFGELLLTQKRDEAVRKALTEGAPAVQQLLGLLYQDLKSLEAVQLSGLKTVFAEQMMFYNSNVGQLSIKERQEVLNTLKGSIEKYEAALLNSPVSLVNGMLQAHQALVVYASSKGKPQDLAQVASALEVFSRQASSAAAAISELHSQLQDK